jgi:hypothetical protein
LLVPLFLPALALAAGEAARSPGEPSARPAEQPSARPADEEARLADAWRRLHPGQPDPPRCPHADPVRQIVADLDDSPGQETALASLRWGVILLAADGRPLASVELGCGDSPQDGSQVIELQALRTGPTGPADLVARTRQLGHCGRLGQWLLFGRRGATLQPLLAVEEDVDRRCGGAPEERFTARVEVTAPGALRVTVDGVRTRGTEGPPERLHRTTDYVRKGGRFLARD